ncbi:hypothetical protein HYQ45_000057 [Verticillium longisporum]|uniref:Uncharacterized protein n=1 Tax=Verticillium longisporum TaxID=100787 RepID=A0A8I3A221_VERLO|nr:hypothetical protein HYQ45_000057 [Verticillium longisporum]
MATRGASARLRKTFHYPADSDSDSSQPEAIDEQEQESLIARLTAENASRNATFRLLLLPLPLVSILPYILASPPSFTALLATTSLLATAYLLYSQQPDKTGLRVVDDWLRPAAARRERQRRGAAPFVLSEGGPLDTYLPLLNLGLCAVVALTGAFSRGKASGLLGYWPAVVYTVVLIAKVVMGSVDPEGELSALKYDYKGA